MLASGSLKSALLAILKRISKSFPTVNIIDHATALAWFHRFLFAVHMGYPEILLETEFLLRK